MFGIGLAIGDPLQCVVGIIAVEPRESADHGLPDAAFELSHMYRMGNGVEPDAEESRKWTVRAAKWIAGSNRTRQAAER